MALTHPHAEASYRVILLENGSFGVEVSIPASHPTTVSAFITEADAEAWITDHQRRVQSQTQSARWFRGASSRSRQHLTRNGQPRKSATPYFKPG
jgi:predicted metal-dependent hydrolase